MVQLIRICAGFLQARYKKTGPLWRASCPFVTVCTVTCVAVTFILFSIQQVHFPLNSLTLRHDLPATRKGASFQKLYQRLLHKMNDSLYRFDSLDLLLPLMQISKAEQSLAYRVAAGRRWLRSQSVVVAATVRNGISGLPSSMRNVQRLRALFGASWLILVENDSNDATRSFLYNMTQTDPTIRLLGCGSVNSPLPCSLSIRYSSGRNHVPGFKMSRNLTEEIERGLVMSALRNQYLDYIYDHLVDRASLLLVIDPDLSWSEWNLDNIAQGAYYFWAKPRLQQLCAHTKFGEGIYDPCTLSFHHNKHYGEDSYEKSLSKASDSLPPVKVDSCFQAMSFYRMSVLAAGRLHYEQSPDEWICEHNTLSRQLAEVYIDPQMRLRVTSENAD